MKKDFESLTTDDSGANQLVSAFKDKMIKLYKNKIEQNLFQKPERFGDLAKKVGDILGL